MEGNAILEFRGITKRYPGTVALDNVTLSIEKGEIHAICGENGAGKSTLIKTCSGAITPTSGEIYINGKKFDQLTPALSRENGIAVIYQEFNLVNQLSVTENVFLGEQIIKHKVVPDMKEMHARTKAICDEFDIDIDPHELVENLSVGKQQIVEIVKAVSKNAQLLIMDEPTAPLTVKEVELLMRMVDKLKQKGITIIYISHRLDEVFQISDRVSVFRDGTLVKTMNTAETNKNELIRLMVGREIQNNYPARPEREFTDVVLETKNLTGNGVENISIKVRKGEVVGLGGITGAGRTEFSEMLFGIVKPTSGEIFMEGQKISITSPSQANSMHIAYVPEDRKKHGIIADMPIGDNVSLAKLPELSKYGFVDFKAEKQLTSDLKQSINIKTPDMRNPVSSLSGGNQQKVILAKWLATNPKLIILDEPTRGIDVGAKYEIYLLINELVERGMGILLISSDMEELIGLADRIVVLSEGVATGELLKGEFDREVIMQYASIAKEKK